MDPGTPSSSRSTASITAPLDVYYDEINERRYLHALRFLLERATKASTGTR